MQIAQSKYIRLDEENDILYIKVSDDKSEITKEYKRYLLDFNNKKIIGIEITGWKNYFYKMTNVCFLTGMEKEMKVAFIYMPSLKVLFFNFKVGKAKYEFFA